MKDLFEFLLGCFQGAFCVVVIFIVGILVAKGLIMLSSLLRYF